MQSKEKKWERLIELEGTCILLQAPMKREYMNCSNIGLDSLIFDLEELVPPELKIQRESWFAPLLNPGFSRKGIETVVRINPVNTYWYVDDILELVKVSPI